ncbi:mucin-2 [Anastrepha ludens]|uniref:mucin-2 n=1 Tax=Anastrepha ludens TaxID=28586 RepID=UPI0023AF4178|nr:mucin-2 [Anastrepha ludens]XP_053952288.1 mucin-2 [Anastrepha ludens]XP_053952289.1 mucin-2 [Anastrepha ludens]XP_053952290.1 mucin-2 [Anastrepha ludens]XP_053952291.1 mucin-2 [Anastrepha ludens]
MSSMKNGFSTLNRWLGKKSKTDKATPNGKLSKSSTNLSSLSVSSTNINETSQLEYNRITPLPAATSNAPFEQTFRITVLLPKDQLYVARLGARVPLSKLLELVCENKLLDASKYEFRNPVDPSQVYSCDLTIGAVGLSEIRLCLKSESYDNFNADEIIKLHRTAIIRDSLSSSEFSSRYSKHTTKTTSPYSSSNSLNSMDSTGMNCVRTPVTPPATLSASTPPNKLTAPPRKKRTAPRPPSQTAIPEKTVLVTNGEAQTKMAQSNNIENLEFSDDSLSRNNRFASTPNLSMQTNTNGIDSNGNINNHSIESEVESSLNGYAQSDVEQEQSQVQQKNARNKCSSSVQNLSGSGALQQSIDFPEPSPRKRMIQIKKKVTAPAPPPRVSIYADSDTVSINSMTPSTPDTPDMPVTPLTPNLAETPAETVLESQTSLKTSPDSSNDEESRTPQARNSKPISTPMDSSTPVLENTSSQSVQTSVEAVAVVPKPLPRVTTNTSVNCITTVSKDPGSPLTATNTSKILLNRTPTPEPRSISAESSDSYSYLSAQITAPDTKFVLEQDDDEPPKQADCSSYIGTHIAALKNESALEHDDEVLSKQADSGIGEPVPSPIPDSLPSEGSAHEGKSVFESSSDDDDIVKIYNFKLGKTVVKSPPEPRTLEDLVVLSAEAQTDSEDNTPAPRTQEATPNFSDSASWNFAIPISPPPNFADGRFTKGFESEKPSDMPITPKIKQRPVLDFQSISNTENHEAAELRGKQTNIEKTAVLPSPTTPLNEIVDELSAIINENRLDSLIKKTEDQPKIEAAKPNTLSNFSITTITQQAQDKQSEIAKPTEVKTEVETCDTVTKIANDEQSSNSIVPLLHQTHLATDITNTDKSPNLISSENSLPQLSESKIEQNGFSPSRRRSSGELSIGESPSLQSPEVIKTILNSRKNSFTRNSDGESKAAAGETEKFVEKNMNDRTNIAPIVEIPKNFDVKEKTEEKKLTSPERCVTHISERTEPKELPKIYRYSGPPSINFSTWNERPKVQVSIKNEGDYIFGGKNADCQSVAVTTAAIEINTNSQTRNSRVSMPASVFWAERENAPPPVSPKPTTITERMGIPEKEYRVPITVKPLRDVTVENVDQHSQTTFRSPQEVATKTVHRKSTSITTVLLNGDSESETNKNEAITQRTFATTTHTSTLPRRNANRFSMPAANIVGPALLRSTSITQLEANKPKPNQTETPAAPFGQNTLRKTGLKEIILAKEAEAHQKVEIETSAPTPISKHQQSNNKYSNTISNGFVSITKPAPTTVKTSVNQKPKPIQSAKLELKLQNSTSVYLNQSSTNSATTITTTSNTKSAEALAAIAPPPPPAPAKDVMMRTPNNSTTTTPSSPDPRDQLFVAIRNFKREDLNRV